MIYVYLAAALLIAVIGVAGVLKYNGAIEDALKAEQEAATLKGNLEDAEANKKVLQDMLDDADRLAKEAGARAAREREKAGKLAEDLKNARKDPDVAKWMDTPVPEPIRSVRRASDAGPANNSILPSPGGAASGNARASTK